MAAPYSTVVLADGPVGYWRFGEAPGSTTMTDASPSHNTGTYLNGVTLGRLGAIPHDTDTAASFDGVDDIGRVPDSNSLDVGTTFSLEGWIKRSTTAKAQTLFDKGANGLQLMVMSAANGNQVWLRQSGVTTLAQSVGGVPADGGYHHVVVTARPALLFLGTSATIYIDGQPDSTTFNLLQAVQNTSSPLTVGSTASAPADYDEFGIYPRVLTAAEVLEHFQGAADILPTAVADSATVVEDSVASAVAVLGNDTDPDGGPKFVFAVTQPAHGAAAITGGGTGVSYTPNANYCNSPPGGSPDTFTYKLNGGSTATVSVTVTCVDDPPVAVADTATVAEDSGPSAVDVLANDTDVDGGPKAIASVTQPANGAVAITGGTGVTYTPDADYCNTPPGTSPDTFTYTLTPGGSSTTVSIAVTCVNDPPAAGDEMFDGPDAAVGNTALVVDEPSDGPPAVSGPKKSIAGDILAGDSDPDGPGPLVVVAGTYPTNDGGSVVLEADGDFTFTPAAGASCTDHSDFFDYTVSDQAPGTPGTDTGRVTIAIAGCVWYVDNAAPGNAGTSTAPFDTLAQAQSASSSGDTIFLQDGDDTTTGYDAGFDLKTDQRLIGEAATLQIGADVLQTATPANRPTVTDSGADVVKLASGSTVRGVQIDPQGTGGAIAGGDGTPGGSITGATIDDVRIIDTGTAGTQPGLDLDTTSGTFDVSDLTVANGGSATASGVRLNNAGTVNFLAAGTISITTSGAKGLDASGTSLGSGSVFDDITVTGSGSGGVRMLGTTGKTTFGDGVGVDLSLTTTSGNTPAFQLNNAGDITVPGAGTANIDATGNNAVDVRATSNPSLAFDDVSSTNSIGAGIVLNDLDAGTFSASGGTLGGSIGIAIGVTGGSGAVTYGGTINDGPNNLSARITNRTGGVVTLSGDINDGPDLSGGVTLISNTGGSTVLSGTTKTLNTTGGSGIAMGANSGHTLSITGGGLHITTTAGAGMFSSGGGTINVTGPGNTIAAGAGGVMLLDNVTIGASNMTFQRVSATGAPVGIRLNDTGSSGRLIVTGAGGTCTNADTSGCSGGEIRNTTGADSSSATPTGTGIVLNKTADPSFTRMWLHGNSNYAIRGHDVAGFTLADSVINGVNGSNAASPFTDGSVAFDNLTGSATISGSDIRGGYADNVRVANASGSLDRLTLSSTTIGDNDAANGNDGVTLSSTSTAAALKATVQNSTFTGARADLLHFDHAGSGPGDLVISGSAFSNGHAAIPSGAGGLTLSNGGTSGPTTFAIDGSSFRDAVGAGILAIKSTGASTQSGSFTANTIGVAAVADSGSAEGSALKLQTVGQGAMRWAVTGNQIHQYNNHGIEIVAGGGAGAQSGAIDTTITGNTIDSPGSTAGTLSVPKNGVHLNIGTVPGDTFAACAVIGGAGGLANNLASGGKPGDDGLGNLSGGEDVRLRQRQATTIRLPGYAGSPTDTAAVQAFVTANNPSGTPTVTASASSPPGGGYVGTGSACP